MVFEAQTFGWKESLARIYLRQPLSDNHFEQATSTSHYCCSSDAELVHKFRTGIGEIIFVDVVWFVDKNKREKGGVR